MKNQRFGRCFWAGLLTRLACAPVWLAARPNGEGLDHSDEFWGAWLSRVAHIGFVSPHVWQLLTYEGLALWSGFGLWVLVRWFRQAHGPTGDAVALRLAWVYALAGVLPLFAASGVWEAASFAPVCLLWWSVERREPWRSGWWAGWAATLDSAAAVWTVGALALAGARALLLLKRGARRRWGSSALGALLGFGAAATVGAMIDASFAGLGARLGSGNPNGLLLLGGLADWARLQAGSWQQAWSQLMGGFTARGAPPAALLLGAGLVAMVMVPALGLFSAPAVLSLAAQPARGEGVVLQLVPLAALAVATAWARGKLGPWSGKLAGKEPRADSPQQQ